jgi:hypothetical protein
VFDDTQASLGRPNPSSPSYTSASSQDRDVFPSDCASDRYECWSEEYDFETDTSNSRFAKRSDIGPVWAAVQAELIVNR